MKKSKSNKLLLLFISIIAFSVVASENNKIDLKQLEGNWEGNGEFLIPGLNTEMEITGNANFTFNDKKNFLRTALMGEKFMFTYSDSGHLAMDKNGDSLTWEVWDNFGRYAKYRGKVQGNKIIGSRMYDNQRYDVVIEIKHNDTIDFRLTTNSNNGTSKNKASFHLWRVK